MKNIKKFNNQYVNIERRRIQRDAHDKVYNRLSAMAKKSELLALEFPSHEEKLNTISDSIRQVITDLQDIINGNCCANFASAVLVDKKMKQICREHYLCYKQEISFEIRKGRYHLLKDTSSWHLLCILQECLNNAGKHSNAKRITIRLFEENYNIHMHVKDDGEGVNQGQFADNWKGQGLKSIKQRIGVLGGDFDLISCPQNGTSINVKIPLPRN